MGLLLIIIILLLMLGFRDFLSNERERGV